jgi:hypothetical protein
VDGTAGGEPLHFEAQGVGRFVALAGIPIEGPDSFPVTLRISYGDGSQDTVAASVFVRQPDYTMEKLRVAPAMAKPDSAGTGPDRQGDSARTRDRSSLSKHPAPVAGCLPAAARQPDHQHLRHREGVQRQSGEPASGH